MLKYPQIDPVAISIGPIGIHWYGIMYLIGFGAGWWLLRLRADQAGSGWTREQVGDLIFYGAMGVIFGGRLGYVLFYDLQRYIDDPMLILRLWEGGMSFHGGLIGVLVAIWVFARKSGKTYFEVADFGIAIVPIGLGAGRIGNFINGELWGRVGDVPWAMVFPGGGPLPRHPSQLYEALLEGLVLFIVLWLYSARRPPAPAVAGLFLALYGVFRSAVEFFREPDAHLGYLAFDWLTMGQLLSLPMILAGFGLMVYAYRRRPVA